MLIVSANPLELGDITKKETQNINGLTYQYIEVNDINNQPQKLFYAEFLPDSGSKYEMVIHHVEDEQSNFVGSTVMQIASDFELKTNQKVVAAINGDFFIDYVPVDYYVQNGVIIHEGPYSWKREFGFDQLGNSVVGRMNAFKYKIKIYTSKGLKEFEIAKFNEEPLDGEIAVFESTRYNTIDVENSGKYILKLDADRSTDFSLPITGMAYRLTKGTVVSDATLSLKTGQLGICIKGDNEISQYFYNEYNYGVRVEVVKIPSGDFSNLPWVIGGYSILMKDGNLLPEGAHSDNGGDGLAPRTSIGITTDGKYFITVIDGRQSNYSVGVNVNQQGQLVKDLGAYSALELDGGGSSTFLLRVNDELKLMNKPSDGQMRKVSNAILIVEKESEQTSTTTTEIISSTTEEISTTTEMTTEETTSTTEQINNSSNNYQGFNVFTVIIPLFIIGVMAVIVRTIKNK